MKWKQKITLWPLVCPMHKLKEIQIGIYWSKELEEMFMLKGIL